MKATVTSFSIDVE